MMVRKGIKLGLVVKRRNRVKGKGEKGRIKRGRGTVKRGQGKD